MCESVESKYYEDNCKEICKKYKGLWIAISDKRVIASDKGITMLYEKITPFKKTPLVIHVIGNEVQLL